MGKWRLRIGLGVTLVWATLVAVYVWVRWEKFTTIEPNALGDFAAGAVGPIAFTWLILGYLQQGQELQLNTTALTAQAEELRQSVAEQKALVETNRRMHDMAIRRDRDERMHRYMSVQPQFSVICVAHDRSDSHCWFDLLARNVAQPCSMLRYNSSEEAVSKQEEDYMPICTHGGEFGFRVRFPLALLPQAAEVVIEYFDGVGMHQFQVLDIDVIAAAEISIGGPHVHPPIDEGY